MKQIPFNEVEMKTEKLKDYLKLLLDNGYRAFVSTKKDYNSYILFGIRNSIGYVELDKFFEDQFVFSSKNKPNKGYGTGVLLNKTYEPTLKDAYKAATHSRGNRVEYWESIDEYWKRFDNLTEVII